ncbi:transposase family protein [Polaromonas naphthalenivorans]|uniref:H repeat-associated protein N-terminal domain-containing protein n=1 Tax=Polaromonas naphthalenivorans (strain CJ2) TaxID=365044 RepID=A1VX04_POLNA|nr:hypothetical protein Pnap_4773 [Polaromonas naphthalenivorans CJ2]
MLIQAFSILPDPRTGPAQRYDLREMIVMTLSAVLCGADNWVDVPVGSKKYGDSCMQVVREKCCLTSGNALVVLYFPFPEVTPKSCARFAKANLLHCSISK